jgi:uncharacterized protein with FMN-binding domain
MRRAAVITGVTVVGAAWLLTYKATPPPSGLATTSSPPDQTSAQPSPGTSPAPTPSAAPAAQAASGTFTGQDVPNRYGDVKVQVVVVNGRITDVKALQLPSDRAQSAYISQAAGPLLRNEVLQAQSAHIDIVSGATYTSDSYAQSTESALQQAHMG